MINKVISKIVIIAILAVITNAGCADKIVSECEIQSIPAGNANALSKFSQIQSRIFTPTCALSGCHGSDTPQANLVLVSGQAYANLVNVNSLLYPQYARVQPGNSSESLLIKVLGGGVPTIMPPSGRISQNLIDSIAAWIDNGALNN